MFSLATGHLYERFLKIMMLSVVKRASLPVPSILLFCCFETSISYKYEQPCVGAAFPPTLRRRQRPSDPQVKFWLFENFLSPTFKQSAEAMAEAFGFEV